MSRKERKERADRRRLEIAGSLRRYMKEVAEDISDVAMEADIRWVHILTKGDLWVQEKMKQFPQEAHMYRSAAFIVKSAILEELKKEKITTYNREERSWEWNF